MTIKLLVKKLCLTDEKIITSDLIRGHCKKLRIDYYMAIRYLIHNRYLYRILRGIFYKPSIEERKLHRIDINYREALREALELKGIKNWYWGLETALKLNNLTHEYFIIDFLINDSIFRAKTIPVLGHKIKFIKLKKEICNFGFDKNIADLEKTILDIIYLSKYDGLNDEEIESKIRELLKYCSKGKLLKYAKNYNKSVVLFVKGML